jgi:hypothetical protein
MHNLEGGCHCGNIALQLELPHAPPTYRPRACDCDFCRKHGAAWVSDRQGALVIRLRSADCAGIYRQGSGVAEMLYCRDCAVLVAALYREADKLYGVANARSIAAGACFGAEQPVSPRTLAAAEKVTRWHALWFADVRIVTEHCASA